ncbi:aminopeptidase [Marinobacter sp. EVN1]|uniref:PA4642 family protein n=1 Tax=unclassified Marinobacter TaxID=83889 RepID=UPI0003B88CC4|nr:MULTISPECIES: PA4642 family protein [unclassified Marinobacter]ERS03824.1 aminopeptidase [Marinobacter sp. EN3]ERS85372.1 aminopeptidase [Marinobacter sp. C1S70]ERS86993.1 aminopeptidase [Marinobacter sp. EVN1]
MSGPDKPKVIGEEWSDDRVKSYLDLTPWDRSINADYFVLSRAYESMRAEDFERFISFFVEARRDLNAEDEHGATILDRVARHRRSADYARALENAGAQKKAAAGN